MITPALDLQGAPQRIDRIGSESVSPDGGGGGDFGAAFTASLSSTHAAAGSSAGKGVAGAGQNVANASPAGGSSRITTSKTTSTSSKLFSTAARQEAGIDAGASLGDGVEGAGVDALGQTLVSVPSTVAGTRAESPEPATTALSGRVGLQAANTTSAVLSESQKIALAGDDVLGYGLAPTSLGDARAGRKWLRTDGDGEDIAKPL